MVRIGVEAGKVERCGRSGVNLVIIARLASIVVHRKRIGRLVRVLLPLLVSVIEAIDWLLLCREGLRIPRRIKGRIIIGMNKGVERVILDVIETIVSPCCSWGISSSIILALLPWIHCPLNLSFPMKALSLSGVYLLQDPALIMEL